MKVFGRDRDRAASIEFHPLTVRTVLSFASRGLDTPSSPEAGAGRERGAGPGSDTFFRGACAGSDSVH